jgi:hypothetical protein
MMSLSKAEYNIGSHRVRSLLDKDKKAVVHQQLTEECKNAYYPFTVYQLSDGRVLYVDDESGDGSLHPGPLGPASELSPSERLEAHPIGVGKVPRFGLFESRAKKSSSTLANKLGVLQEGLDYSVESLKLLDNAIDQVLAGPSSGISPRLFEALVAYVGCVLISQSGGRWYDEYDEHDGAEYPCVISRAGRVFTPSVYVADRLDEPDERGSLHAIVLAELGTSVV